MVEEIGRLSMIFYILILNYARLSFQIQKFFIILKFVCMHIS